MAAGYRVEIVYLKIDSPQLALERIAARVKQGGHEVPRGARARSPACTARRST